MLNRRTCFPNHNPNGFVTFRVNQDKLDHSKFKKVGGGWWRYLGNVPASALEEI